MHSHEHFMARCLELARRARNRGEHPCGALVVQDGQVLGEGLEATRQHADVTFHAEIEALRHARQRTGRATFEGATLYTTHEPCPMCAYAIRQARFHTVVFGVEVGTLGSWAGMFPLLQAVGLPWGAPPRVVTGVLVADCRALRE
jgi:tRNA(adenine34) deaminase